MDDGQEYSVYKEMTDEQADAFMEKERLKKEALEACEDSKPATISVHPSFIYYAILGIIVAWFFNSVVFPAILNIFNVQNLVAEWVVFFLSLGLGFLVFSRAERLVKKKQEFAEKRVGEFYNKYGYYPGQKQ